MFKKMWNFWKTDSIIKFVKIILLFLLWLLPFGTIIVIAFLMRYPNFLKNKN